MQFILRMAIVGFCGGLTWSITAPRIHPVLALLVTIFVGTVVMLALLSDGRR